VALVSSLSEYLTIENVQLFQLQDNEGRSSSRSYPNDDDSSLC
jgi:hypothetical protein